MTVLIAALVAVILCYLHTRTLNSQRRSFEDRLDGQAQRHAMDLRKLLEAAAAEHGEWHRSLDHERVAADSRHQALLEQLTTERAIAADERVQLLNRIKPDTFQLPLSQPDAMSIPPAVPFEDDEAFWRAAESRDELVDRIERELQAARAQ